MQSPVRIRPIARPDHAEWRVLWDGYNAFYGREGATALPEAITRLTWQRFLDPAEPMHADVAVAQGEIVGLVHYLYHRSTTREEPICYLSDLFAAPQCRGQGVGRALIASVYAHAASQRATRVYWQTHESNTPGRRLYDQVASHLGSIVYSREF